MSQTTTSALSLPQPQIPFLRPDGNVSREWVYYFLGLLERTGGIPGIPIGPVQQLLENLAVEAAYADAPQVIPATAPLFVLDPPPPADEPASLVRVLLDGAPPLVGPDPFLAAMLVQDGVAPAFSAVAGQGLAVDGSPGGTLTSQHTLSAAEPVIKNGSTNYTFLATDSASAIEFTGSLSIGTVAPITLGNGFFTDVYQLGSLSIESQWRGSGGLINGVGTIFTAPYQSVRFVSDGTNALAFLGSPFAQTAGQLSYRYSMMIGTANVLPAASNVNAIFGQSCTISAGANNLIAGNFNSSTGATGNNLIGGKNNTASGLNGLLIGNRAVDWSLNGGRFQGSTANGQSGEFAMATTIATGTTPTQLTMDGAAAAATNTGSILGPSALAFTILAEAVDRTNGGFACWLGSNTSGTPGVLAHTSTLASSATLASGFAFTAGGSVGTFSSIGTFSLAADTTHGGFNLTYTPGVGNTGNMKLSARIAWTWAG